MRLTTLPPSCAVVMKSGNLNFLEPSGPLQACNGTALPSTILLFSSNSLASISLTLLHTSHFPLLFFYFRCVPAVSSLFFSAFAVPFVFPNVRRSCVPNIILSGSTHSRSTTFRLSLRCGFPFLRSALKCACYEPLTDENTSSGNSPRGYQETRTSTWARH